MGINIYTWSIILPNTEKKSSSMQSSNQMQNQAVSKNWLFHTYIHTLEWLDTSMGLGLCWLRRGWRRVKRDTRMGSGQCRRRRGLQHMRMGLGLCRPRQGWRRVKRDTRMGLEWWRQVKMDPPTTKWVRGRGNSMSSKDAWECQREEPRYILGKIISWAMALKVWMPRFGRRLKRMKGMPYGVNREWNFLIVLSKWIAQRSVFRGRGNLMSLEDAWKCRRKEPHYILIHPAEPSVRVVLQKMAHHDQQRQRMRAVTEYFPPCPRTYGFTLII